MACTALVEPVAMFDDHPDTKASANINFTVWACTCSPDIAEERGVECAD